MSVTGCRILMWSYVTLDRPFTHISLKQFALNFMQHLHSNRWSKTEFLAVLSPRKPTETLTWLWNWTWRFTETICFIRPVHQWALNTVQKSQPSPGRSHFLSSQEDGMTDWLDTHEGIKASCNVATGRSGGWYCKHPRSSNTVNWHFKRKKSGHPQNLKDALRCVQTEYHLSRPPESSRHLWSFMPQHDHTWRPEKHCRGSESTLVVFDALYGWWMLFQKSLTVQPGALKEISSLCYRVQMSMV